MVRALSRRLSLLMVLTSMSAWAVNLPPVIDGITFSTAPVQANSTVTITCRASDDSGVATMRITVTGGALPGGGTTADVSLTPGPVVLGTVAWSTPAAGVYSVSCNVADDAVGSSFGPKLGSASVPVTVVAPVGNPPVIDALIATPTQVKVGGAVQLTAAARDPDNDPLTYAWSADVGAISGSGTTATFTAPAQSGGATVTLSVSDGTGQSASASVVIQVRLELYAGGLPVQLVAPRRLALGASGDFLATDGARPHLAVLTARGELKAALDLPEIATAVTRCWGETIVSLQSGRVVAVDDQGHVTRDLALRPARAAWPMGLACDSISGLLFIAEHDARRVRAVEQGGATRFELTTAGAEPLGPPTDVAVDPVGNRVLVLIDNNRDGARMQVRAFAPDGAYQASFVPLGSAGGAITRGAGLAVGPTGRIYVSDGFQSVVQVFDPAFTGIGEFGGFGSGPGALKQPAGMAVNATGDLVVASTGTGRLEVYGQPLGSCPGDRDCDGLPDAWEQANGLNPLDPRDAYADPDGDGLTNAQELARNTNPRNADSDGDGFTDGEEVLAGLNPNFPGDHPPVLVAKAKIVSNPGLVRLAAELRGRGSCRVLWSQVAGPSVPLYEDTTATPAFVGRAAGPYAFEGRPSCNGVLGAPQVVQAEVRQVAPRVDPGRIAVVKTGQAYLLDSSFSWDPNAEALTHTWDQVLGPPRLTTSPTAQAWVRPYSAGLYGFQATLDDAAGQSASEAVPVLVVEDGRQAPTAIVVTPVQGRVGGKIVLDASGSVGPPGALLQYGWRQVLGPASVLVSSKSDAYRAFQPFAPGHYRFEVTVADGVRASPPQAIDVYVATEGASLPVAVTATSRTGVVGEPLTLSAVRSLPARATLEYRWRQVSGAAAGLTNETAAAATVVPFAPGVAVFEVVVLQGEMESLPVQVTVTSDVAGQVRPVAVARGPAVSVVGQEVVLDGSASTGTARPTLRHRWTQVAGPWAALEDSRDAVSAFTPLAPGLYVFELEVDDGVTRSAAAPVGVLVFPAAIRGGGRP